jgi:nitroimidazol reductase NimA-like FMN-containing flavoprotein (pyridoxamine 5'-phosphate oxidase superfamily)
LPNTHQAPPLTDEEVESMLKASRYARVCTHNKDGTIHAMPVAYRYINGQIVIISNAKSRKNRNVLRNNDVSVLIDTLDPLRGMLIYGTAEIDYDNIYEQAVQILEGAAEMRSMPKEKVRRITRAYLDAFESVIMKITPKHITTFDYTKDDTYQNFLKTYLQE